MLVEIRQLAQSLDLFLPGTLRFRVDLPGEGGRSVVVLDVEGASPHLIFEDPDRTSIGDSSGISERAATEAELTAVRDALRDDPRQIEKAKARIADARWRREIQGCEVMPGVVFPTTRESRADLAAELADAERIGETYSNVFVIGGVSVPVTLATLQAVNAAVRVHVRQAFAWQDEMLQRIASGENLETVLADVPAIPHAE